MGEDRRSEGFVSANCRSAAAPLGLIDIISVMENIIYDKIKITEHIKFKENSLFSSSLVNCGCYKIHGVHLALMDL